MLSRVQLFETPWTLAHQAPLSLGILQARMGCHLPDSGIEAALQVDSLPSESPGKPLLYLQ